MIPPSTRLQRIMTLLRNNGEIRIGTLIQEFNITPMTAWRDLQCLAEQGLLRRVRGGARLPGNAMGEPNFETKTSSAGLAKSRIAFAALREFVREGDIIAMEGGTTVAALIDQLPERRISVVTNSLPIALQIRAVRPALPVRVIGGWLSSVSGNTTGPDALKEAKHMKISVFFMSATGWNQACGPMDPNPLEIEIKRAFAASAARVVLLMDSSKFQITSTSVMIHPRRIHALITDAPLPEGVSKILRKEGVRIIVAE